jgi:hypothetical protein
MNYKIDNMEKGRLKYFRLAKELNDENHELLVEKKFHFRGNENSISLISLNKETAEKGISNITDKEKAKLLLENLPNLEEPKRNTPEKVIQAWIIHTAMKNNGRLPFKDNLTFITSELVFKNKEEYNLLEQKKDIRNDILAFDNENNLCIVELKYTRSNDVKKQTLEFEKVVKNEFDFFNELLTLHTNRIWNKEIRKISVWPYTSGSPKKQEFLSVEEVNYIVNDDDFSFL